MKNFDCAAIFVAIAIIAFLGFPLAWIIGDLDAYAKVISGARDIIVAAAASFGAYMAWRGLKEWKRQFNAKNQYKLTRRVLKSVYELRDGIHDFRRGFILGEEMMAALIQLGEKIPETEGELRAFMIGKGTIAAYHVRLLNMMKAVKSLRIEMTESEMFWGQDAVGEYLFPLIALAYELHDAHHAHSHALSIEEKGGMTDPELKGTHENKIRGHDTDHFGKRVTEVVTNIEKWLRPKLMP